MDVYNFIGQSHLSQPYVIGNKGSNSLYYFWLVLLKISVYSEFLSILTGNKQTGNKIRRQTIQINFTKKKQKNQKRVLDEMKVASTTKNSHMVLQAMQIFSYLTTIAHWQRWIRGVRTNCLRTNCHFLQAQFIPKLLFSVHLVLHSADTTQKQTQQHNIVLVILESILTFPFTEKSNRQLKGTSTPSTDIYMGGEYGCNLIFNYLEVRLTEINGTSFWVDIELNCFSQLEQGWGTFGPSWSPIGPVRPFFPHHAHSSIR